jgi:hypothetical protein
MSTTRNLGPWKITLGLSAASFLLTFLYFLLLDHNPLTALKMSGSSILTLAASHVAHRKT